MAAHIFVAGMPHDLLFMMRLMGELSEIAGAVYFGHDPMAYEPSPGQPLPIFSACVVVVSPMSLHVGHLNRVALSALELDIPVIPVTYPPFVVVEPVLDRLPIVFQKQVDARALRYLHKCLLGEGVEVAPLPPRPVPLRPPTVAPSSPHVNTGVPPIIVWLMVIMMATMAVIFVNDHLPDPKGSTQPTDSMQVTPLFRPRKTSTPVFIPTWTPTPSPTAIRLPEEARVPENRLVMP